MATLAEIENVGKKISSAQQWLDQFSDDEKTIVTRHIIAATNLKDMWRFLRELDDNPFPYSYWTIRELRQTLQMSYDVEAMK